MATNQGFKSFIPDRQRVHSKFLYHWLRKNRPYLESLGNGATFKEVSKAIVSGIEVPLPPLAEQRRIAAILDKADELRAKRRAALAKLDSLTQSIFLDMFGDPATNPKGWPIRDLAGLCEKIIDCPHATPSYATQDTAYLCVRSSDIQNEELDLRSVRYVERSEYQSRIERGRPQVGDVIYCREGARFGNAARIRNELNICLGQRMMILRPDRAMTVTEYIWAFLSSRAGNDQAFRLVGGSASPHINIRDIKTFRLPIPPISIQREFARRVCAVDDLKVCQQRSMQGMDSCFTSLQHRAFQGEL